MSNIDKLCEITGVKRADVDEIWKQVKANNALLDGCVIHDFSICLDRRSKQPIESPTRAQRFGCKWKCFNCGGVVDNLAKIWYVRGLIHGAIPIDRNPKRE